MRAMCVFLVSLFATVLYGSGAHAERYQTSKQTVLTMCGGALHSANGQTGCAKCDAAHDVCRDFNCSDGSHGVKKGCTVTTFIKGSGGRKVPTRGSVQPISGDKGGVRSGKPIRHPVGVTVKNPPATIKTDPTVTGKGGGLNQTGGHHR